MAITNNANAMNPASAPNAIPPIPAYAGSGGVLASVIGFGGQGYRTGPNNANTRLYDVQGVYLVRRLRLRPCASDGSFPATGTVKYSRAGFGPEFADNVAPLIALSNSVTGQPIFSVTIDAGLSPCDFIDLYDVWFRPATSNEGVQWECEK